MLSLRRGSRTRTRASVTSRSRRGLLLLLSLLLPLFPGSDDRVELVDMGLECSKLFLRRLC